MEHRRRAVDVWPTQMAIAEHVVNMRAVVPDGVDGVRKQVVVVAGEAETVSCVWYSCATRPMNAIIARRPCCNSLVAIVAKPDASAGANRRGSNPMSPG